MIFCKIRTEFILLDSASAYGFAFSSWKIYLFSKLQVKNIDLVDWSHKRLKNTKRVGWLSYQPQPGLSFKA